MAAATTIDAAPVALAPQTSAPMPVATRVMRPAAESGDLLLSPTTQLYVRWDGIAAHNDAYKKSIWGPVMAGPTGDSIRALLAKLPKLVGNSLLADPLLDGKSPKELEANLKDLKHASKFIELVTDRGAIVGGEIREPKPTLQGVGSALGGLFGGKMPGPEALSPTRNCSSSCRTARNRPTCSFPPFAS